MRENTFPEKIALIKTILRVLIPIVVLAGLVLVIATVNLIADASPKAIEIKRVQELAIIFKQGERDRAEFERLRRKHGLAATAVVIYEPGETPYYYGSGNEKVALK
jgi:hypothetical protein